MVWIADNPRYDADDKQLLKYLGIHLNKPNSDKIVKTLSLYKYLKKQKINSPKDIELSAYYDKERRWSSGVHDSFKARRTCLSFD